VRKSLYRISSRSIAFVFVDLTVKYEVLIPGIAKPDVVERPEIQPGASHTFALGPIGADLILIGPNGESKSIKYAGSPPLEITVLTFIP
jgi:hypothetical protein